MSPLASRRGARALLVASLLALSTLCAVAADRDPAGRPDWERWRRIELVVRDSLLFSGRFEMVRDTRGELTRLETAATARLLGARVARSRSTSVLDERLGRSRSHTRISKRHGRRFEFDDEGYTVSRLSADSFDAEPARWAVVDSERIDCPTAGADEPSAATDPSGSTLLDVYGLLLHLRFRELDAIGDRTRIRVGSKRGPVVYDVVVVERRRGTRRLHLGAGSRRVELTLDELRLRLQPADENADAGFLNMEGETELWVEARSKAPVEIRGRVPRVGRVSLVLDRLDAPPAPR